MDRQAETVTNKNPRPYSGFDGQYIDGALRPGLQGSKRQDTDPYSGETLAEIAMANQSDLDAAYQAAAHVQPKWAAALPAERATVMLRSAAIMQERHQEIVDWLIRESGSTRLKAELEWQLRAGHHPGGRVVSTSSRGPDSSSGSKRARRAGHTDSRWASLASSVRGIFQCICRIVQSGRRWRSAMQWSSSPRRTLPSPAACCSRKFMKKPDFRPAF